MGALQLTLTDKGERRLLASALGRFNRNTHSETTVNEIYKWGSLKLRLFKNDHTVSKATTSADLTEADTAGYEEIDIRPIDFVRKTADSDTTNTVYSKEYTFDFTGSGDIYGAYVCEADAAPAVANVDTIVAEADSAGSLGGKAFLFWSFDGGYYVWFNTGSSSDPHVEYDGEGLGSIEVAISSNDTAATIGGLVRTAITNADVGATISGSTDTIIITMDDPGSLSGEVQDDEDNGTGWSSFTNTTPGAARFFSGTHEATKLVCTDGSSLDGKYFGFIAPSNDGNNYPIYVWYDTGSSTNPEPAEYMLGATVFINASDTAAEVAAKTVALIDVTGYDVYGILPMVADGDTIYIENNYPSAVDPVSAGDSGFTVTQLVDSSDTGVTWFAGNFASPLSVVDGDDIKITLQLTIN